MSQAPVEVVVKECSACCGQGYSGGRAVVHVKNGTSVDCNVALYCEGQFCDGGKTVPAGREQDVELGFPKWCGDVSAKPCYYGKPKTCNCRVKVTCGTVEVEKSCTCEIKHASVRITGVSYKAPCSVDGLSYELCVYVDVVNEGPCTTSVSRVVKVLEGSGSFTSFGPAAPLKPGDSGRITFAGLMVKYPLRLQIGVGDCDVITDTRVVEVKGPGGGKPPSIVIESVSTDKAVYEPGERVTVTATVRNAGDEACTEAWLKASLDGREASAKTSLGAGEEKQLSVSLQAPSTPGSYGIDVRAGCGSVTTDEKTMTIYVRQPQQPPLKQPPKQPKPRFEILDVRAPSSVESGESYTVTIVVGNTGDADGKCRVEAYLDGSKLGEETLS